MAKAAAGDHAHVVLAVPGQRYEGVVIGSTERYIVQEQKDRAGEMILHSRRALVNVELAAPGQVIEIRYPHGGAGLVEKSMRGPDSENTLQRQKTWELDR